MAHFKEVCAYCAYLNTDLLSMYKGKFKCDRDKQFRFADIDSCNKFCEIFWHKSDASKAAYDASKRYREAGCHITTAIVKILGLPEDCHELAVLKDFRVRYMENNPKYTGMLTKYDKLGPIVAESLHKENNADFVWDLFNTYIKKTADFIIAGNSQAFLGMKENENYDTALELYIIMTKMLIRKYIPNYSFLTERKDDSYSENASDNYKIIPKKV